MQDPSLAAPEGARVVVGARACDDEDAEFAEEGEGGFVGLAEPAVGRGWGGRRRRGVVAGEGGVAVDEFDVFAAAAVGPFHDDARVVAEGAVGSVVVAFAVRGAGPGPVGVFGGRGGGDGVEGVDVGEFGHFAGDLGLGGEGAEELFGAGGLEGGDRGVDGADICNRGSRFDGPVEEDDAGAYRFGE